MPKEVILAREPSAGPLAPRLGAVQLVGRVLAVDRRLVAVAIAFTAEVAVAYAAVESEVVPVPVFPAFAVSISGGMWRRRAPTSFPLPF